MATADEHLSLASYERYYEEMLSRSPGSDDVRDKHSSSDPTKAVTQTTRTAQGNTAPGAAIDGRWKTAQDGVRLGEGRTPPGDDQKRNLPEVVVKTESSGTPEVRQSETSRDRIQLLTPTAAAAAAAMPAGKVDGLEHLRRLLGVMERMEELREKNQLLQQKCAFLEDTKMLLKEQNSILLMEHSSSSSSAADTANRKPGLFPAVTSHPVQRRSSADDRKRRQMASMHEEHRSQSVSSVCDLVEMEMKMERDVEGGGGKRESGGKTPAASAQPSEDRPSMKIQKTWKQMKNVFSAGKAETGVVTAEILLRSNSRKTDRSNSISAGSPSVKGSRGGRKTVSNATTPSIVLGHEVPLIRSLCATTSRGSIQNSCSHIPEERRVFSLEDDEEEGDEDEAEEETDDSAFTPWMQQTPPRRRQSSPMVKVTSAADQRPHPHPPPPSNDKTFLAVEQPTSGHVISRSSSFKAPKAQPEVENESTSSKSLPTTPIEPAQTATDPGRGSGQPDLGRRIRGPLGKVIEILQTRRGSLKVRNAKPEDDGCEDLKDDPSESGSTPSVAATINRRGSSRKPSVGPARTSESCSGSARGKRYSLSSSVIVSPVSPMDLASLFGVNDEFTKKMNEWEEKKRKNALKMSGTGSTKFSEDFIRKMEEWEQKKGHGAGGKSGVKDKGGSPSRVSPEGAGGSYSPQDSEEVQKYLSESFSRTVQDWEQVRRRHSETRDRGGGGGGSRKKEGHRSVSRERDKSQQRTEKELRKIEKKEQKLEQELTKLAQLRSKLDPGQGVKGVSQGGDRRVSQPTGGAAMTPAAPGSRSVDRSTRTSASQGSREECCPRGQSDGAAFTGEASPSIGSGMGRGRGRRKRSMSASQTSLESLSSVDSQTGNGLEGEAEGGGSRQQRPSGRHHSGVCQRTTSSPGSSSKDKDRQIVLTSKADEQLRKKVKEREKEVTMLREEVKQLQSQIKSMKKVYTDTIEQFQKELWSPGRFGQQVAVSEELSGMLSHLGTRLHSLQEHGDQMAREIGQTQAKIAKEANSRRQMERRFLSNLEQLHFLFNSGSMNGSLSEAVLHLCSHVSKLLAKTSALRQCLAERLLLIQELERHLLVQEVINKLLQADIERQSVELSHLREFHRLAVIKRWKTFNGNDYLAREEHIVQENALSRQPQQPSLPRIPQSCKQVQALLAEAATDPEPFDIDADWLDSIRAEAEHALRLTSKSVQTERHRSANDVSVQTVLTSRDLDTTSLKQPPTDSTTSEFFGSTGGNQVNYLSPERFPCGQNKPRKTSAPEFSTEESAVWIQRSTFHTLPPSSTDHFVQNVDSSALPRDLEAIDPVLNKPTDRPTKNPIPVEISPSSAIHGCPEDRGRGSMETDHEGPLQRTAEELLDLRRGSGFSVDADDLVNIDDGLAVESDVFSSSEDGVQWGRSIIYQLKETRIDDAVCFDDQKSPTQPGDAQHLRTVPLVVCTEPERATPRLCPSAPGMSRSRPFKKSSSPIVVRKLKSATELMIDCEKRRPGPSSSSVSGGDCGGDRTPEAPDRLQDVHHLETAIDDNTVQGRVQLEAVSLCPPRNGSFFSDPASTTTTTTTTQHESISLPSDPASPSSPSARLLFLGHFKPITQPDEAPSGTLACDEKNRPVFRPEAEYESHTSSACSIPTFESGRTSPFPSGELSRIDSRNRSQDLCPVDSASGRGPGVAGTVAPRTGRFTSRSSGAPRSAKSMCRALCLQAMSVELTDDSADSSTLSHASSLPQTTAATGMRQQSSPRATKGNWLEKPMKLFKALK